MDEIVEATLKQVEELEAEYAAVKAELTQRLADIREIIDGVVYAGLSSCETEQNQRLLASHLYYFHKDLVRATDIGNAVGVYANAVKDWVYPITYSATCSSCGQSFKHTENKARSSLSWNEAPSKCPQCIQKLQDEQKRQIADYTQTRRAELEHLRTMPYGDYLKTEHWKTVRNRALKRAGFRCQMCNSNKRALHVHHRTYENRGQEQPSDLIVLCDKCHEQFHTQIGKPDRD